MCFDKRCKSHAHEIADKLKIRRDLPGIINLEKPGKCQPHYSSIALHNTESIPVRIRPTDLVTDLVRPV